MAKDVGPRSDTIFLPPRATATVFFKQQLCVELLPFALGVFRFGYESVSSQAVFFVRRKWTKEKKRKKKKTEEEESAKRTKKQRRNKRRRAETCVRKETAETRTPADILRLLVAWPTPVSSLYSRFVEGRNLMVKRLQTSYLKSSR